MEVNTYKILGWSIISLICGYAISKIYYYLQPTPSFLGISAVITLTFFASYLLAYLKEISFKKFYGLIALLLLTALSTEGLNSIKNMIVINTSTAIVLGVLAGIGISIAIIYLFYQEE